MVEWMETAYDGSNSTAGEDREYRGGLWIYGSYDLVASYRENLYPTGESLILGFRVASVPEPSALSLLALGGAVVALGRRKRI